MCGIVGILGREPVAEISSTSSSGSNTVVTTRQASPLWKTAISNVVAPKASYAI
jgi:hypothetical protein